MDARKVVRIGGAIILITLVVYVVSSIFPQSVDAPTTIPGDGAFDALIPLTDMGERTYLGFEGGLYPGGSNEMPEQHRLEGLTRSNLQPLDTNGNLDTNGKIVLLSIGVSNTSQEFCARSLETTTQCSTWSFMGRAAQSSQVDHKQLAIVNGAMSGQVTEEWVSLEDPNYERILQELLLPQGFSEGQVQVIWLKLANADPVASLPDPEADAYLMVAQLGNVLRTLQKRYPNLKMVFLTSRTYGGYGDRLSPEPFAYESGFAVKWLIEAQINQMLTGTIDSRAGDINYNTVAPWVAWGPYLWANGNNPRSDGLMWVVEDFRQDGIHPSRKGEEIVGNLLFQFFSTSPFTREWFLAP